MTRSEVRRRGNTYPVAVWQWLRERPQRVMVVAGRLQARPAVVRRVAVMAAGAAVVVLLLWGPLLLVDLTPADRANEVTEERRTVLAVLVAFGGAAGIYYTHLRHQLDRDSNFTDRYTKAVEQLGHDSHDVQLGGIYALERIALDSVRDRGVISEVLSAFIREHTRATHTAVAADAEGDQPAGRRPSTVVQAALRVLSRRPSEDLSYPPADLTGADLTGADLSSAKLNHARLGRAKLAGAMLSQNLTSPNLSGAHVVAGRYSTELIRADLAAADLTGADLTGVLLIGANLADAKLTRATVAGATLTEARLHRADLAGADLTSAVLLRADLSSADLTGADLAGADLRAANLVRANLAGANLARADLTNAVRTQADLTGANLDRVIGLDNAGDAGA